VFFVLLLQRRQELTTLGTDTDSRHLFPNKKKKETDVSGSQYPVSTDLTFGPKDKGEGTVLTSVSIFFLISIEERRKQTPS